MPLLPYDQRTPEWLEARRGKITASLAGACLGLDPHTGPLAAFNRITGRTVEPDNPHMAWGREFESHARGVYEALSGHFVAPTGLWVHDDYPWLAASPDGLIRETGLVEIKCPGIIPSTIPDHHEAQMRVQMACTGRAWCDYFAWSQAGEFCRRVNRDRAVEEELIRLLESFYRNHIKPDLAPPRRRPTCPTSATSPSASSMNLKTPSPE